MGMKRKLHENWSANSLTNFNRMYIMKKTILVNKRVEYAQDGTPVIVPAKGVIYDIEFQYIPPRGTTLPDGHILVRASSGEKWQARVNNERSLGEKSKVIADYIAVA